MRAFLFLMVVLFGVAISDQAYAQDYMRQLRWECDHGNGRSCRLHHLYRDCQRGDRYACREVDRMSGRRPPPPPGWDRRPPPPPPPGWDRRPPPPGVYPEPWR